MPSKLIPKRIRTLYRAEATTVVKTTGTEYPDSDADGHQIFENRHFKTEAEAWRHVIAEATAGVSLSGHCVIDAKNALLRAQEHAGLDASIFAEAMDNFKEWERTRQ